MCVHYSFCYAILGQHQPEPRIQNPESVTQKAESRPKHYQRLVTSSCSAAQPEANVSSSSAAQPARQLSTISAVLRWLSTLTEQTASARLKDISAAAEVLETPRPRKEDVRSLCKTWSVKQKDRPLPEIIRDLIEKVIDASNELKVGLGQPARQLYSISAVLSWINTHTEQTVSAGW